MMNKKKLKQILMDSDEVLSEEDELELKTWLSNKKKSIQKSALIPKQY